MFHALDFTKLGLFPIHSWDAPFHLDGTHVTVEQITGEEQTLRKIQGNGWVDPDGLRAYLDEERERPGSPCPALVDYEVHQNHVRLRVTMSEYYEHVAIRRYLRDHPEEYQAVADRIGKHDPESDLRSMIRSAPNSNIVINVTVQSRNGLVMMLRRSVGARVWPHFYQAGAHETMNWNATGHPFENAHELAVRALREEVNLAPDDYYNNIKFSWFGFYAPDASTYLFAHVRSRLEEDELVQRAIEAESSFEIDNLDWCPLEEATVRNVINTWQDGPWTAGTDDAGRKYLPHTVMSFVQLWRVTRTAGSGSLTGMAPGR